METSIFTAQMRSEFLSALNNLEGVPPAPWEAFTTQLKSTARIEQYAWMSSVPGLKRWRGYRQFANMDSIKYEVRNDEYSAEFSVRLRDVEDDQIGGYKIKPKELVAKAMQFPGRLVLQTLAAGASVLCFDGTNFFASTHAVGSAGANGNNLTGTAAGSDGQTCRMVFLIKTGEIKPVIWQDRKPLSNLMTDEASPEALKRKQIDYWVDCEMAAAFGFWWDALMVTYSNTPTLTELQTTLGLVQNQFRTFALPKGLDTDQTEYVHEQLVFSPTTCTVLCSTNIEQLMRTVVESETIVQSGAAVTNIYRGFGELLPTAYLNPTSPTVPAF